MNSTEIEQRLLRALNSKNVISQTEELADDLKSSGATIDSVLPILLFIERNPDVDFGAPGPLVHFVERFFRQGYEAELMKSVARCPTQHNVWMLNRVLNGVKGSEEREHLIATLRSVQTNPQANLAAKNAAINFIKRAGLTGG